MRLPHRILTYILISVVIQAFFCQVTQAQIPIKLSAAKQTPPDSIDVAIGSKRHFWRTAAEVAGFNVVLWAFDRYVQKGDYAYISLNSVKENYRDYSHVSHNHLPSLSLINFRIPDRGSHDIKKKPGIPTPAYSILSK